jgi:hypothetical protein
MPMTGATGTKYLPVLRWGASHEAGRNTRRGSCFLPRDFPEGFRSDTLGAAIVPIVTMRRATFQSACRFIQENCKVDCRNRVEDFDRRTLERILPATAPSLG